MPIWSPAFFGSGAGSSGFVVEDSIWLDGSSDYLNKTFSGTGTNRKKFTFSCWFKLGSVSTTQTLLSCDDTGSDNEFMFWVQSDATIRIANYVGGTNAFNLITTPLYRDPTAWYNLILEADSTPSTPSSASIKLWINGVQVTAFSTETYPSQNFDFALGNSFDHEVGRYALSNNNLWNGYIAEMVFIDGTDYTYTDFGEVDDNGVWVPKNISGLTFGTNGFHLDFAVAPGTGNGAGTDVSGNNNHFTDNSMTAAQSTTDTCTDDADNDIGNYWTLNPLQSNNTLTGGNLAFTGPTNYSNYSTAPALPMTGKWYWEIKAVGSAPITSSANWDTYVGVLAADVAIPSGSQSSNANLWVWGNMAKDGSGANGQKHNNSSVSLVPAVNFGDNAICMIAVDMDNSSIWFGNDGTWAGSGNPAGNSNAAFSNLSGQVMPYQTLYADSATYNFGATAFAHTPPTGFKALNTANLPAPTVTKPSDYFGNLLWTGNDGGSRLIATDESGVTGTSINFTPDFVWIKRYDGTQSHFLFDSVRTIRRYLHTNTTDAESGADGGLVSFAANGFNIDNTDSFNTASQTRVAWCMKAGGAPSADNTGDRTPTNNSVMKGGVAQTASNYLAAATIYPKRMSIASHGGFSITTYTGDGTSGRTIPHGLDRTPGFVVVRNRTTGTNTHCFHDGLTDYNYIISLEATSAQSDQSSWSNKAYTAAPTSTLITVGNNTTTNKASATDSYVMYCFARTPGLIGIGSYIGNGVADGPSIVVDDGASGFRPAWIMFKNRSRAGYGWSIFDVGRETDGNPNDTALAANNSTSNSSVASYKHDILANGFKIRGNSGETNYSGDTIIYLAMASSPFGGDTVAQARPR